MRMLVKYTAFIDMDQDGQETDRSYYLSFINKDDVMDLPFDSLEELKEKCDSVHLAEYIKSGEFKEKAESYEDFREFFQGVDTLVLYDKSIAADFSVLQEQ
ncbi:hypothetical protein [Proteiniclasticum sp. QWL-01]|uniref:hypothetical protein n=1 Tax=Proteiniclasticum sp. QWL-01 TaxID=3036945 RepID=UPI0024118C00|nr:hypothetical protein [Proteiniclasticum sp. QWL-01]WFF74145.1 hypothetical protein P6M73_06775 [Proteiniclasticum sp. QWL-01]